MDRKQDAACLDRPCTSEESNHKMVWASHQVANCFTHFSMTSCCNPGAIPHYGFHLDRIDRPFEGLGPVWLGHYQRPTQPPWLMAANFNTINRSQQLIIPTTPTECVCIRPFERTRKGIDLLWFGPWRWKTDTAAALQSWGYWNECFDLTWMNYTVTIFGRFGLIVVLVYCFGM